MIYNYTKCESVIAKIMADLDISEKNIRITDIREWIFEAVDKIGAPMQYIQEEGVFKICDKQVPIPCGLQALSGVAYSPNMTGPWTPMRSNTSTFKQDIPCDCCKHEPKSEDVETKLFKRSLVSKDAEDPTYFIKPGWIVTNQKEGYLRIAYKKIATDERGYPIIPDLTSYQEAIFWYVTMKINFPKYLKGKLGGKGVSSSQNTYFYLQQQWNFYRNQAYAECMMPNEDQLKSIKNDWNKLVPDYDSDEYFFKSQGEKQTILSDYFYGY